LKIKAKKDTRVFISLCQPDGRLQTEDEWPYRKVTNDVMVALVSTDKAEAVSSYDNSKLVLFSQPKQYREVSCAGTLKPGNYVLVPSTKQAGQTGQFYLSIYFECDASEVETKHLNGNFVAEPIVEESTQVQTFDDKVKFVMKCKAKDVIFKEDNAQK